MKAGKGRVEGLMSHLLWHLNICKGGLEIQVCSCSSSSLGTAIGRHLPEGTPYGVSSPAEIGEPGPRCECKICAYPTLCGCSFHTCLYAECFSCCIMSVLCVKVRWSCIDGSPRTLDSKSGFLRSVLFTKDGSTVSWELPKLLLRGGEHSCFHMQLHIQAAQKRISSNALVHTDCNDFSVGWKSCSVLWQRRAGSNCPSEQAAVMQAFSGERGFSSTQERSPLRMTRMTSGTYSP